MTHGSDTLGSPQGGSVSHADAPDVAELAATHRALVNRLAETRDSTSRAALKDEIVALFRAVEAAEARVGSIKSAVKELAGQWRSGETGGAGGAGRQAHTGRVDHLGASTFIEKGWSRLALGEGAMAEEALLKALALAPGDAGAESMLGWAYMLQEKYDEALLRFHHVLLRDPHQALARANVGYVCLRRRSYGEAIEHLSRAIRLDNDPRATMYAHLYLGMVYFEREMFEDAKLFYRKALVLGPNLLQAYYELGRAHWFAEEREAARTAWREGAAANTFNPWGKRCAEQLASVDRGEEPPRTT
jgi:tetratricopeptide (TPR) repeat protein